MRLLVWRIKARPRLGLMFLLAAVNSSPFVRSCQAQLATRVPLCEARRNMQPACPGDFTVVWSDQEEVIIGARSAGNVAGSPPNQNYQLKSYSLAGGMLKSRELSQADGVVALVKGTGGTLILQNGSSLEFLNEDLTTAKSLKLTLEANGVRGDFTNRSLIVFSDDDDPPVRTATFVDMRSLKRLYTVTLEPKSWLRAGVGDRSVVVADVLGRCIVTVFQQDSSTNRQIQGTKKGCYAGLGFVGMTPLLTSRHGSDIGIVQQDNSIFPMKKILPTAVLVSLSDVAIDRLALVKSVNKQNILQWIFRQKRSTLTEVDIASHRIMERHAGSQFQTGALSPNGKYLAIVDEGTLSVIPMQVARP